MKIKRFTLIVLSLSILSLPFAAAARPAPMATASCASCWTFGGGG